MRQVRILGRTTERQPDCLAEMLLEFLKLDHAALLPGDLDDWLRTVAACVRVFLEHDGQEGKRSLGGLQWLQTITIRLARAFPNWPGGRPAIQRTLQALMFLN
jgi:hypothetical protein